RKAADDVEDALQAARRMQHGELPHGTGKAESVSANAGEPRIGGPSNEKRPPARATNRSPRARWPAVIARTNRPPMPGATDRTGSRMLGGTSRTGCFAAAVRSSAVSTTCASDAAASASGKRQSYGKGTTSLVAARYLQRSP